MVFLLHYCPNHWGRESRDTPSRNHQLLYITKTHGWPLAVVRTYQAPGFQTLANYPIQKFHPISIEIGRIKNANKNPVAERAVQEVREHILRVDLTARAISPVLLSLAAVAYVNKSIRQGGLSAREILTPRDQFTNRQLSISDRELTLQRHQICNADHASSERSKASHFNYLPNPSVEVGTLVYLYCDKKKSKAKNRYLVVSADGERCQIRQFVGNQLRQSSNKV